MLVDSFHEQEELIDQNVPVTVVLISDLYFVM